MKLKFIAAAALAALLGSSAASAGEDVGWYAIGSVGAANADSNMHDEFSKAAREGIDTYDDVMSNLSETDRDNLSSAFARASVKTDFAFKLGLGYRFNDYFALEGAYYYLGKTKSTLKAESAATSADSSTSASATGRVHAEVKGHMLALDAVGILPINDRFELFGKVGIGAVQTRNSLSYSYEFTANGESTNGSDSFSKNKIRLAPKIGVGAEFYFVENWAVRAEYERVWNASKDSDESWDIDYNIFTVGVKYLF